MFTAKNKGDDSILGGGSGGGRSKKGKKLEPVEVPAVPKKEKLAPMTHSAEVFKQFDQLDMDPPMDHASVQACVDKLHEKVFGEIMYLC